jgi:hypothetical protein
VRDRPEQRQQIVDICVLGPSRGERTFAEPLEAAQRHTEAAHLELQRRPVVSPEELAHPDQRDSDACRRDIHRPSVIAVPRECLIPGERSDRLRMARNQFLLDLVATRVPHVIGIEKGHAVTGRVRTHGIARRTARPINQRRRCLLAPTDWFE